MVLAVSSIVPRTCRIPRQVERDLRKLEGRRGVSFGNLVVPAASSTSTPTSVGKDKGNGVESLGRMQLLHISWSLGLSSSIWDYLGGQLPGLPTFILRRKVRARITYLEMDDTLLMRGKIGELVGEEVKLACVERGIDVLGREGREVRGDLHRWVRAREGGLSVERLLLMRYVFFFQILISESGVRLTIV